MTDAMEGVVHCAACAASASSHTPRCSFLFAPDAETLAIAYALELLVYSNRQSEKPLSVICGPGLFLSLPNGLRSQRRIRCDPKAEGF